MMQTLNNLAVNQWPTMMAIAALCIFGGFGFAAKMDNKLGYVVAVVGLAIVGLVMHAKHFI